jgi:hypothetical protein
LYNSKFPGTFLSSVVAVFKLRRNIDVLRPTAIIIAMGDFNIDRKSDPL